MSSVKQSSIRLEIIIRLINFIKIESQCHQKEFQFEKPHYQVTIRNGHQFVYTNRRMKPFSLRSPNCSSLPNFGTTTIITKQFATIAASTPLITANVCVCHTLYTYTV